MDGKEVQSTNGGSTAASTAGKKWNRQLIHHHVFNTLPNLFSLIAFFIILFALVGVSPMGKSTGVMVRLRAGEGSSAVGNEATAEMTVGLLGACYKPPGSGSHICTPAKFYTQLNSTLDLAGSLVRRQSFPHDNGDVAPVVLTWLVLSIISIPVFVIATLPGHFPKAFAAGRYRARPCFTAALGIQGTAWVMGFTSVLAIAEEVNSYFSQRYNVATARFPTPLNVAEPGNCVAILSVALSFQLLVWVATLVCREVAPTREGDMFKDSWNAQTAGRFA